MHSVVAEKFLATSPAVRCYTHQRKICSCVSMCVRELTVPRQQGAELGIVPEEAFLLGFVSSSSVSFPAAVT